jgi:hypothetical protein
MTTTTNKSELLSFLEPLIDFASKMLLAGTLKKNAIKHFTNSGLPFEVAENLVDVAVVRTENLMKNKVK